jgi:hypothetical protein
VYLILIAVSVGGMTGRIAALNSVDQVRLEKYLVTKDLDKLREELRAGGVAEEEVESQVKAAEPGFLARHAKQRPFLSANDRSRWCAVRALVERGTYAIDEIQAEPNWDTIDMVKHDGRLYSSKPPLLPTLMAGEYWVIYRLTGWTLGTHPYEIGRFMTWTVNVLPLALAFLALGRLVERCGTTDWGRIFAMATATLGTFLSTFAVSINNHVVAAVSAVFAVAAAAPIWMDGDRRLWRFAAAGFFSTFAAANELPALSLVGLLGLVLMVKSPLRTLLVGLPAALVVAAAFFGTNYLAHGTWMIPYAQRADGRALFSVPADAASELDGGSLSPAFREQFAQAERPLGESVEVLVEAPGQRWIVRDSASDERYPVVRTDAGLEVRTWGNWYDYSYERGGKIRESYWKTRDKRSPIDQGEPDRGRYVLHALVGHHGVFSLTPVWLLTVVGIVLGLFGRPPHMRALACIVLLTSAACLAFYLGQDQDNRNYGGMTSGLRWMFWFAPLWCVAMLPAVDAAARCRWSRGASLMLLALSVLSASYPTWNPWTHPWLVNVTNYFGWTEL